MNNEEDERSHVDDVLVHEMCEYMEGAIDREQAAHIIKMVRSHQ